MTVTQKLILVVVWTLAFGWVGFLIWAAIRFLHLYAKSVGAA